MILQCQGFLFIGINSTMQQLSKNENNKFQNVDIYRLSLINNVIAARLKRVEFILEYLINVLQHLNEY